MITIASYFSGLCNGSSTSTSTSTSSASNNNKNKNNNVGKWDKSVALQRYNLLAGTPSHMLKPIMLELAVYHLSNLMKWSEHGSMNSRESMFSYAEKVLFSVIVKSMHAAKVVLNGMCVFSLQNSTLVRRLLVVLYGCMFCC